jgi:hypothetical protein
LLDLDNGLRMARAWPVHLGWLDKLREVTARDHKGRFEQ